MTVFKLRTPSVIQDTAFIPMTILQYIPLYQRLHISKVSYGEICHYINVYTTLSKIVYI